MAKTKNQESKMALPKRINPCPITQAIVEIRFEAIPDPDIILSLFHLALKDYTTKSDRLPIADIPHEIRDKDVHLKYQPFYKFTGNEFIYHVGSRVASIHISGEYPGWKSYLNGTQDFISRIQRHNIFDKVIRVGMRYISTFNGNILPNLDVDFNLRDNIHGKTIDLLKEPIAFKSLLNRDDFNVVLQVTNMVEVKDQDYYNSVIDVDVSCVDTDSFLKNIKEVLNLMHQTEKEIFFGLLKPNFLKTLSPEY